MTALLEPRILDGSLFEACRRLRKIYPEAITGDGSRVLEGDHCHPLTQMDGLANKVKTTVTFENCADSSHEPECIVYFEDLRDVPVSSFFASPEKTWMHVFADQVDYEELGIEPAPAWALNRLKDFVPFPPRWQSYTDSKTSRFIIRDKDDRIIERPLPYRGKDQRELTAAGFFEQLHQGTIVATDEHLVAAGLAYRVEKDETYDVDSYQLESIKPKMRLVPTPRKPLEMHQNSASSCATTALANLRWMYRLSDEHNELEVDRLTKRSPGNGTPQYKSLIQLLTDGFMVQEVDARDEAKEALLGFDYVRKFFKRIWTEELGDWLKSNHHEVLCRIERLYASKEAAAIKAAGARFRRDRRKPTLRLIRRLLDLGYVIILQIDNEKAGVVHTNLIIGHGNGSYLAHDPGRREPALLLYSHGYLAKTWQPESGIFAVKH